jgi:hypothetical protein
MAKGQMRSNKEAKKPKQPKTPAVPQGGIKLPIGNDKAQKPKG